MDYNLRPSTFDEFVGQTKIIDSLKVYIKASLIRDTSLDHVLLIGHPGLGKTTLAYLIANELNRNIISINANSIDKPRDLIVALSKLNEGDVLFIDEIHALSTNCEEILYSAMEEFYINLNVKESMKKELIKFELPPFTLVGATTRAEDLSKPLYDRFPILFNLEKYTDKEIMKIIERASDKIEMEYDSSALKELASVSRKTPRIALNIFKRINDFALIENINRVDKKFVLKILNQLGIRYLGLNSLDIRYLNMLHKDYADKPVGINTISSFLNENVKVIEEMTENYLIELAFIRKTSKGRVITQKGITYLHSYYKKHR